MRLAHHLLRHPSGIPRALQALIGRKVIKQSLRTRDPVIAKAWAYALGAQYAQILRNARERGMPNHRYRVSKSSSTTRRSFPSSRSRRITREALAWISVGFKDPPYLVYMREQLKQDCLAMAAERN